MEERRKKMKVEIKDGKLYLELPISHRASKSGKSKVLASTGGNIPVPLEYEGKAVTIFVGVNAYTKG